MTLTVGIDAGHGGSSSGAIWPVFSPEPGWSETTRQVKLDEHRANAGFVEANLNLCFARYLHSRIEHSGEPVKAVLIRHREDEALTQKARGALSTALGCQLVISIHHNAGSPAQRGAECYHWPGNLMTSVVGDAILDAMPPPLRRHGRRSFAAIDTTKPDDDWIRRARAVLSAHACPVVLVEIGYLTREDDRAAISDPATQAAICSALEVGVARWRQHIESPQIAGM